MNLSEYQHKASATAIYPEAGTGSPNELAYLSLGLGGETGEVLEKTKKLIRDGTFDRQAVAKELGDVLWYLSQLTNAIGYNLEHIAQLNLDKLGSRQERGVLSGSGDER